MRNLTSTELEHVYGGNKAYGDKDRSKSHTRGHAGGSKSRSHHGNKNQSGSHSHNKY